MSKELLTFLGDARIGVLTSARDGRVSFNYDTRWRSNTNAFPLSLSMPLTAAEYGHAIVQPFLWGLLPDSDRVLDAWGKQFQVSSGNPFALLKHVGEDCAGAVRFVDPEREDVIPRASEGEVDWLAEKQIGDRLRALKHDITAWRAANDTGHFSLGGAQPKTALLFDGKRWGVPSGRLATTHILKPDVPGLRDHSQNEHFCLALAAELGLPVASSKIEQFDGEIAIVVARYDRAGTGTNITRIHQEDLCQALGVHPARKYENEGGPGAKSVTALLRNHSSSSQADIDTFMQALALNWLLAGTDAHAKNYSLLIAGGGQVRLAPLYDVASVLPYDEFNPRRIKLAMKIGGKYRVQDIGLHQWRKLAAEVGLAEDRVLTIVRTLAAELPDRAMDLRKELAAGGLDDAILARVSERIAARSKVCADTLA